MALKCLFSRALFYPCSTDLPQEVPRLTDLSRFEMRGGASVFILGEYMKVTHWEVRHDLTGLVRGFNVSGLDGVIGSVSVSGSQDLAQDIAEMLEYRTECKELIKHLKRPGLIGGRHGG